MCTLFISHEEKKGVLDVNTAIEALEIYSPKYDIESIMTFGGEPMLYPDTVCSIHKKASEQGIGQRQLITNGFWTKDRDKIDVYSKMLKDSGVNNILVSVDFFHEEHLDFEIVKNTVKALSMQHFESLKVHPCWYESPEADNKYDSKTRNLLKGIADLRVEASNGNVLFPDEEAVKNYPERFSKITDFSSHTCTDIPYNDFPDNVESICIDTDGKISICGGESYSPSQFLEKYDPFTDKGIEQMIRGGSDALLEYAKQYNVLPDKDGYYDLCEFCRNIRKKIKESEWVFLQ